MISSTWLRTASSEMPSDSRALAATPSLMDQPEQDVLGADVVVIEQPRFLLSKDNDAAGPVVKTFEQDRLPWRGLVGVSLPVTYRCAMCAA